MESRRQDDASDEDIPSDFFDDFNKEEFIEGLSVIDSWDVKVGGQGKDSKSRIGTASEGVRDLRELISDGRNDVESRREQDDTRYQGSKHKCRTSHDRHSKSSRRESSSSRMDNYIKPGSRRDLRKTNEAIKKDKEVKVKEYLSKHLDSIEDIKPPGTELDDFLNKPSSYTKRKNISKSPEMVYKQDHCRTKSRKLPEYYPQRERHNIHRSPPYKYMAKHHRRYSPQNKYRHYSPDWRQRRHYSPSYSSKRNSKTRRSSIRRSSSRHSRRDSRTPVKYIGKINQKNIVHKDSFLYPNEICQTVSQPPAPPKTSSYVTGQGEFYVHPSLPEHHAGTSEYLYSQNSSYPSSYNVRQKTESINCGMVQPVSSAPVMTQVPTIVSSPMDVIFKKSQEEPYDALVKLVVEGKLSKEDYLKLAPNKGTLMNKAVVKTTVLNRCIEAITKLNKLQLPNRLILNNALIGQETKSLIPKFSSPLKRQTAVDFYFTQTSGKLKGSVYRNKHVIESVISTIGLSDIVSQTKKIYNKNMKDAAVQTMKPFCDVCHIRDSSKTREMDTSIDLVHFTSSVHTQVVDQDLINSKSVFNPSGGVPESEPISIAHLTPAQLVSQLAARAKSLKQSQPVHQSQQMYPSQYTRRNPGSSYAYGAKWQ